MKQTLLRYTISFFPRIFKLRMSPFVHMRKLRHKQASMPHTSPKMGHLCLVAKPSPMALDTSPSAVPIQKGASLEAMKAQLSEPREQASGSQRDGGELREEEEMQYSA